jgi:hypothetical protein
MWIIIEEGENIPQKHSQDGLCHWSRLLKAHNNVRIDSTQKALLSQDGLYHWSRLLKAHNNVRIDSTQKALLSQLTLRFTDHGLHGHSPSNCTMQHSATHNSSDKQHTFRGSLPSTADCVTVSPPNAAHTAPSALYRLTHHLAAWGRR